MKLNGRVEINEHTFYQIKSQRDVISSCLRAGACDVWEGSFLKNQEGTLTHHTHTRKLIQTYTFFQISTRLASCLGTRHDPNALTPPSGYHPAHSGDLGPVLPP